VKIALDKTERLLTIDPYDTDTSSRCAPDVLLIDVLSSAVPPQKLLFGSDDTTFDGYSDYELLVPLTLPDRHPLRREYQYVFEILWNENITIIPLQHVYSKVNPITILRFSRNNTS
jgi:hypothetical protein